MSKKGFILFSLLCLSAFFLGVFAGFIYTGGETPEVTEAKNAEINVVANPTDVPKTIEPSPTPTATEKKQYLISLSDESNISVYNINADGTTVFLYKKEVDVLNLRQDDYQKLGAGIIVNSEEEVKSLLEDFTS